MGSVQVPRPLVLVVDDVPDICESLQVVIESALHYPVLTALSAPEAIAILETLRSEDLNLILADYRMDPMDGLAFLQEARKSHPDVPRVLMTAYPDQQLAIDAVNSAGISHFLHKPINHGEVVRLARDLTSKHVHGLRRDAALRRAVRRQHAQGTTDEPR